MPCRAVDLAAQAADLALRHSGHAHGLDQVVHRACRETLDVSFPDDRGHRLFRCSAKLQELREVADLAQLRDLHIDRSGARLPRSGAVAVAPVHPVGLAFVRDSNAELVDIQRHEPVGDEPKHLGQ
jgi:hypothetical protein